MHSKINERELGNNELKLVIYCLYWLDLWFG